MEIVMRQLTGLVGLAVLMTGACSQPAVSDAPASAGGEGQPVAAAAPAATQTPPNTPPNTPPATATANLLACSGPFGPGTTLASLRAAFGANAVREEELNGPEGMTFPGIVINGDDPLRRIEVALTPASAEGPGFGMASVRGGPSSWALPSGITVGSALAEVVAANGGPFKLTGLGWDYGGNVTDWQGGALAGADSCRVRIVFGLPETVGELDPAILGDTIITSSHPGLGNVSIKVSEVGVSWEEAGPQR